MFLRRFEAVLPVQLERRIKFYYILGKYGRNRLILLVPIFADGDHIFCVGTIIPSACRQAANEFPRLPDRDLQKHCVRFQFVAAHIYIGDKTINDLSFRLISNEVFHTFIFVIFKESIEAFFQNLFAIVPAAGYNGILVKTFFLHVFELSGRIQVKHKDCREESIFPAGFEGSPVCFIQ